VSTALSASITRPPNEEATLSPVMAPIMDASRPRNSVSAASPRSAAPNSAIFSGGPRPPAPSARTGRGRTGCPRAAPGAGRLRGRLPGTR
jgi:hypothetical protein